MADDAALLAGQAAGAVRAGPDDRELAGVGQAILDQVVLGHGPRHTVGDGEDSVRSYARGVAILDATKLVDHLGGRGAVGKGHRDHTPKGVRERGGRAAGLAEARNGRPRTLTGVTKKIRTGHGSMYVTMNEDEFGPRECFVILGKPGGTAAAFSDALGRMITMALTHGASPAEVVHQLRGIQDGHPAGVGPNAVLSVPDGVARAMSENYLVEDSLPDTRELPIIGACPDCGSGLTRQEGCVVCHSCGYSKCS